MGAASQWLFNFTFSQITPHAIDNLGWGTFVMFGVFNWCLVVYAWFCIKEVRTLKRVSTYAGSTDEFRQKDGLWKKWSLVGFPSFPVAFGVFANVLVFNKEHKQIAIPSNVKPGAEHQE